MTVLRFLVIAVAIVVLVKLSVWQLEPAMVFFPQRGEDETPAQLGIKYQPLMMRTSDGVQIAAWQLEPQAPTADVVYFHGNGGNLSVWLPVLATLHALGYRVLAIDYRGYGKSEGSPSERGLLLDAETVVQHVNTTRGGKRPLIYWGRSLGGPVAAAAAKFMAPDALVLESTFPDKASVVRSMPFLRVLNVFSSYRFNTVELLDGFSKPVLVVHSERDTIIPFSLGQELFDRLSGPKQFVRIRGADHNDLFDVRDEAYWTPIRAFIDAL